MNDLEKGGESEIKKELPGNQETKTISPEEKIDSNIESLSETLSNNLENAEKEIQDVGGLEGIENTLKTMDSNKLLELQEKITLQEKNYAKAKRDLAFDAEISIPLISLIRDNSLGDKLKMFAGSLFLTGTGMGPLLVLVDGIKVLQEKIRLSLMKRKERKLNTLN
ncbi:MAG: hypothetical protein IPJ53_13325 [Saprospiraceae bacterium]|nr:hypothetical protein [Candidatus Vicinibacter affinis]